MKKPVTPLNLLILLSVFCSVTNGQSLLWKISGNGLKDTSYVYGTIHITDSRVFEQKDFVFSFLHQCEAFASELDLSMENMIKIAALMKLPEGETLHDHFTDEEYKMIRDKVKACSGIELSSFDRIKPPALISLCFIRNRSGDLESTVDQLLYTESRTAGIPVMGIETVEEQISLFDKIPDSYVVEFFKNIDQQEQEFEKLVLLYQKADLDSLLILIESEESGALLNEELIIMRNYRMTDRIIPLIRERSTFIAIGCGHLPGEEGVLTLLRNKGYTVEPVYAPPTMTDEPQITIIDAQIENDHRYLTTSHNPLRVLLPLFTNPS